MLNIERLVDHVKWAIVQEAIGYPETGVQDAPIGETVHYQASWLEVKAESLDGPVIAEGACGFAACIFGHEVLADPDLVVLVRPDYIEVDDAGFEMATSITAVAPRPEGYEGKVLVAPFGDDPEGTRPIMDVAAESLGLNVVQAERLYNGNLRAWSIALAVAAIAAEEGIVVDYGDLPEKYQVNRADVLFQLTTWWGGETADRMVDEAYGGVAS